jgi:hypothetical protein
VFSQTSALLLASVRFAASPRYLVSITLHSITAAKIRIRQVPTASVRNARKKHGILPATKIAYSVNANATPTFWLRNSDNTEQTAYLETHQELPLIELHFSPLWLLHHFHCISNINMEADGTERAAFSVTY